MDTSTLQNTTTLPIIEEKGNLEHAIRCTKQALDRATSPWLQKACAFRLKMLRDQLARQRNV